MLVSGSASVAPPGALEIESGQKTGSVDEGAQTESKDVSIFIVCLIAFISYSYFNIWRHLQYIAVFLTLRIK